MGLFSGLFGGGRKNSPMDAANQYLSQIPQQSKDIYNPYIEKGQAAGDVMSGQFDQMSQDPAAFIDALMKGYSQSEGYKQQFGEMTGAAANTAAAGGMRGTPQDQLNQEKITQGLLSEDMQKYLTNILGTQKTGLEGEQGLYTAGFGASGALGGDLTNVLGQQAGLSYNQQQQKNMASQDWMKALMGGLGTVGGWSLGGPAGGTVGGKLASKFI